MTRLEYDAKAATLLREYAEHYDPQRPGSTALSVASDAITQHAQHFDPAWYPKGRA